MSLESTQSNIWAESYGQNTKTCSESEILSDPILTPIGEILILSFPWFE